jgi:hypothetical protein
LDLHCLSRAFSPECFGIASGLRPLSSQARRSPSLLSSVLLRPEVLHRPSAKRRCPVRGRLCCKSPKMPCDQFFANGANELPSPVLQAVTEAAREFTANYVVPQMIVRSPRVRPGNLCSLVEKDFCNSICQQRAALPLILFEAQCLVPVAALLATSKQLQRTLRDSYRP